jgi:hypothetical protein
MIEALTLIIILVLSAVGYYPLGRKVVSLPWYVVCFLSILPLLMVTFPVQILGMMRLL